MSVSNSKSKYVAYVSVLSQTSNCQGLGRKNKHAILKTDRIIVLIVIITVIIIVMISTITTITTTTITTIIIIIIAIIMFLLLLLIIISSSTIAMSKERGMRSDAYGRGRSSGISRIHNTCLHSAKGGVVETGCSDLYAVVY